MSSIYDKINSTYDLLVEIKSHGLRTCQEDICRAQDIVGREPFKNLIDLANDIGRNDHEGNPSPDGSWSSTRMPTRDLFYSLLFNIWSWEEATAFWNAHTNPDTKKYHETKDSLVSANKKIETLSRDLEVRKDSHNSLVEERSKITAENRQLKDELNAKEREILILKAKLYDLMAAKKGA